MQRRTASNVSHVLCLTLVGCAFEQRRLKGFLSEYSALKPDPTIPRALVFWNPGVDRTNYTAVIIEPVSVELLKPSDGNRASPEDKARFCGIVTDELAHAIGKRAAIATRPAANVLRCRLQVDNLQFTRPIDSAHCPCLPPDYARGTANIETEARDAISGEVVVAYVSPPGSVETRTPPLLSGPSDRWGEAKTIIRNRIVTWTDQAARYFPPAPHRDYSTASPS